MEGEKGMAIPAGGELHGNDTGRSADGGDSRDRGGPTWRSFALSILVAIILSVMVTLLLGGTWSSYRLQAAAGASQGGCGGSCCPLPQGDGK